MWLHNPAIKKGECAKFHNPWIGPYKIEKAISDVNFQIFSNDGMQRKVVHFDRLKKAYSQKDFKEKAAAGKQDSDSDLEVEVPFEKPNEPGNRLAEHIDEPLQDQQVEAEHQAAAADPLKAANENEKVEAPVRKSQRSNKGVPPARYGFTIISIFFLIFAISNAQEVVVFQNKGAVAEKCGQVAVEDGIGHFSMVVRIQLKNSRFSIKNCSNLLLQAEILKIENKGNPIPFDFPELVREETNSNDRADAIENEKKRLLDGFAKLTYCDYNYPADAVFEQTDDEVPRIVLTKWKCKNSSDFWGRRKRALPLLALGALVGVGIFGGAIGTGLGIYNLIELKALQKQADSVVAHLNSLDDFVQGDHKDLIKLERDTHSLYEYAHSELKNIGDRTNQIDCKENADISLLFQLMQHWEQEQQIHQDVSNILAGIFSRRPNPIVLPARILKKLMNHNNEFFAGTIYLQDYNEIYRHGEVIPIFPIKTNTIGFILKIPRIFTPDLHSLYCSINLGIIKNGAVVKNLLPTHLVNVNGSWQETDLKNCFQKNFNSYYCSMYLQLNSNNCLNNFSLCTNFYKKFLGAEHLVGNFGYLILSTEPCKVLSKGKDTTIVNNTENFYYIPLKATGAVQCGQQVLPLEEREFKIAYHFQEELKPIDGPIGHYAPSEWIDERNLLNLIEETESRPAPQAWIRFNNFSFIDLIFCIVIGISVIFSLIAVIISIANKNKSNGASENLQAHVKVELNEPTIHQYPVAIVERSINTDNRILPVNGPPVDISREIVEKQQSSNEYEGLLNKEEEKERKEEEKEKKSKGDCAAGKECEDQHLQKKNEIYPKVGFDF